VSIFLQDVEEDEERGQGPQEPGYEEFIQTLLAPIGDEHRPDTLASSIVFVWYMSQGSPQDRRPLTEDPQGEGSSPVAKEEGVHSHPHSRSYPAARNRYGYQISLDFLDDGMDKLLGHN